MVNSDGATEPVAGRNDDDDDERLFCHLVDGRFFVMFVGYQYLVVCNMSALSDQALWETELPMPLRNMGLKSR